MVRGLILAAAAAVLPVGAIGAVVSLDNGDRMTGAVIAMANDELELELAYGGKVTVPWTAVTGIESAEELRVQLSDDTRVRGLPVSSGAGKMTLEGGEILESVSFALANVKAINPPTLAELEELETNGRVAIGIGGNSGNSETERFNIAAEFTARTRDNRYTAGLAYNKADEDGNTTVDNATVYANYDHFFAEKWFWNNALSLQRNDLQDLDLRTAIGTGVGYQVYETDELKLSLTGGVSYVAEDFSSAPSVRNAALRFGVRYEHDWLTWLSLFHSNEILYSVEDSDDWVVRSRSGVRFPIMDRLDGTFQVNYDFDNSPAPGNEEEDILYVLNLGYNW